MSDVSSVLEVVPPLHGNHDHWRHSAIIAESLATLDINDRVLFLLELPQTPVPAAASDLVLPIRGLCLHPRLSVEAMSVNIGASHSRLRCRESRDDFVQILRDQGFRDPHACGFSGQLCIDGNQRAPLVDSLPQFAISLSDGRTLRHALSRTFVCNHQSSRQPLEIEPVWSDDEAAGPRVFIGMATYNPDPQAFDRQLNSIIEQRHRNWHLLINDDSSDATLLAHVKDRIRDDERISLRVNSTNQGFYYNFETVLRQAPASADFVALADQDDRWYPQKLSELLASMDTDTTLSYCDMRVLNADGSTLSDTYWRGRRNNYKDLDVLLLANTVTGAASIFRYDLLEILLPFPARIGDAFHDHWIACAAMARGKLNYVDSALYDYVQHEAAVVGHCDFETPAPMQRLKNIKNRLRPRIGSETIRNKLARTRQSALAIFRFECRRIELISATLQVRCPDMDSDRLRHFRLYGRGVLSGLALLLKHVGVIRRGHSTDDAEVRLGIAYLVDALDYGRNRLRRTFRKTPGRAAIDCRATGGSH